MTWYLGLTASRLIAPYPGQDKIRGEFAVQRQLADLGVEAHAPKRIDFLRQGKQRYAEPVESPYLRGYIFARIPAHLYFDAVKVKGLAPTLMMVSTQEVERSVLPFIRRAEGEAAEAQRIIDSRDRAAMCQFRAGDAIEALSGPFAERTIKFRRMVQATHDPHPYIEGECELFGQMVKVKLDPLDVRAAE